MSRSTSQPNRDRIDSAVRHTRREALLILAALAVCLIWSVSWCYLTGYGEPGGAPISTVLGMPSWVFGGVLVPWLAADVFTVWFCFFFMADDPLGEPDDALDPDDDQPDRREAGGGGSA